MAAKVGACSHSRRSWLQHIRESGEFSDVIVRVQDQDFHLHTLPLVCASSYFRSLLPASSSSSAHSCRSSTIGYGDGQEEETAISSSSSSPSVVVVVVDLHDMAGAVDAFSVVADFCYLIKPRLSVQNVACVLAIAELLAIADLAHMTKKFLYTNVFRHWRFAIAFLQQYVRVGTGAVDDYIESRCVRTIADKCRRAFSETRSLSAAATERRSSASQALSNVLAKVCSLPDAMAEAAVEAVVASGASLHLCFRQSRNVRAWLQAAMESNCRNARERAWFIVCLTRMLQTEAKQKQQLQQKQEQWLELSSDYWCALLQQACATAKELREEGDKAVATVGAAIEFLQERIGGALHELDEYLVSYKLEARVVMAMVGYYKERVEKGGGAAGEGAEVAAEVDACLWSLADEEGFRAQDLVFLIRAFPAELRSSHDLLYAAAEKVAQRSSAGAAAAEVEEMWGLIDVRKLSEPFLEKAMGNPEMLRRAETMACVLEKQMAALEMAMGAGAGDICDDVDDPCHDQKLRNIMKQVVQANLKLLHENSRRAIEISELKKLCSRLLASAHSSYISSSAPDLLRSP